MFPTDNEFTLLYILYLIMFAFIFFRLLNSKNKVFYKWNLLVFGVYLALMVFIFSDSENFKGGNSLAVLFYGGLFVVSHSIIIAVIKLFQLKGEN